MLWSVTCLILLIHHLSGINSQVTQATSTSKDPATVYYAQRDGRVIKTKEGSAARTDITNQVSNYPVGDITHGKDPSPNNGVHQNAASASKDAATVYYVQRDGRVIKTKEGSAVRTDITDQVSNHPVGDITHGIDPSLNKGVSQNSASTSKDPATVYYVQRDGRVIKTKEGSATRTDVTDQALNHPTGITSNAAASSSATSKLRVIDTNVLSQFLPNTTRIGDPKPGVGKAYPWNPITAESPEIMKKTSLRRSSSIDQIIEKTYTNGVSNYPTKSGHVLTELDMIMTDEQYLFYYGGGSLVPRDVRRKISERRRRVKRKALNFEFTYWPNGEIPYTVDNTFNRKERKLLMSSMQDWMDKTCLKFTPATSADTDVLTIQNGEGCNSFVGRVGGSQSLNLQPACREYHVMKHELGHVIGLIHEHQRPDRDNYITVARQNVGTGRLKNYKKFEKGKINTYDVPYDYTSIMHYGKTAFSKDDVSTTMITRDPQFQEIIGTTSMVSFKDAKIVNAMYNCAGHCTRKPFCGTGYVDKRCQCVCPDGTQSCSQQRVRVDPRSRLRELRNIVHPNRNTEHTSRREQHRRVIPTRRQKQRQRLIPRRRQDPGHREFPTRRLEPRRVISTTRHQRRRVVPTKLHEPRERVILIRPYEPRRVIPTIRSEPRRVIQRRRKEPKQIIQIKRQEPRQVIQIKRKEPRQVFEIRRQEPRRVIEIRRQEPRQVIETRRQEPRRITEIRRQEPRRVIPTRRHKSIRRLIPIRRLEPRQEVIQTRRYDPRQEQGQTVNVTGTQKTREEVTIGTQEPTGQSTGLHRDQLDPNHHHTYITDPDLMEPAGDAMAFLVELIDSLVRKK